MLQVGEDQLQKSVFLFGASEKMAKNMHPIHSATSNSKTEVTLLRCPTLRCSYVSDNGYCYCAAHHAVQFDFSQLKRCLCIPISKQHGNFRPFITLKFYILISFQASGQFDPVSKNHIDIALCSALRIKPLKNLDIFKQKNQTWSEIYICSQKVDNMNLRCLSTRLEGKELKI